MLSWRTAAIFQVQHKQSDRQIRQIDRLTDIQIRQIDRLDRQIDQTDRQNRQIDRLDRQIDYTDRQNLPIDPVTVGERLVDVILENSCHFPGSQIDGQIDIQIDSTHGSRHSRRTTGRCNLGEQLPYSRYINREIDRWIVR